MRLSILCVLLSGLILPTDAFSPQSSGGSISCTGTLQRQQRRPRTPIPLYSQQTTTAIDQDEAYTKAFQIIDKCAASGESSDELYNSVRYIDKNAFKLYADEGAKQQLWNRCHGSWKLQLATGPPKPREDPTFKSVPIFAYAMIDEQHFGNGVGFNRDNIILSLLGDHYFNAKRRQMGIGISDMFLFSNKITQFVPTFMADGMGLGRTQEELGKRMPAFTMIGASTKSMIARGGSGGIAIWTRLEKDIRPAAYGMEKVNGD